MIAGPSQSPYEGGVFNLELFLTGEYPMVCMCRAKEAYVTAESTVVKFRSVPLFCVVFVQVAPKVRFLTKIYHPNIDKLGRYLTVLRARSYRTRCLGRRLQTVPHNLLAFAGASVVCKWDVACQPRFYCGRVCSGEPSAS